MAKKITYQVNFKGGIIAPGMFLSLLQHAAACRVTHVQFGLRQKLLLEVPEPLSLPFQKGCQELNIAWFEKSGAPQNIVSSYPAAGLFTADTWLREGVFKDILNQFDYKPGCKINICDSTQNLVPFFTGHINWVSSTTAHYWHLHIRFPKTQIVFRWPELIYTNDIALVSKRVEQALRNQKEQIGTNYHDAGALLLQQVKKAGYYTSKEHGGALQLPHFSLPYYEGFNQIEAGLWLGLYRRDQLFPVSFLMDVCTLCTESKIGELYATPWKSLIIKNIAKGDREKWNHVLGKYRINVRHAANELAWQVEDGDEDGLQIKRTIIRHFDKEDVRTYGLSFGVQTKPTATMFGSIIIRKQQNKNPHRLKSLDRYDLLYTRDFNPNSADLILFRDGLEKEQLGTYIVSLCKMYYQQEEEKYLQKASAKKRDEHTSPEIDPVQQLVHQCKHCLSVYDPAAGADTQGILPGTLFDQLPADYSCPLCESPKDDFVAVNLNRLCVQSG